MGPKRSDSNIQRDVKISPGIMIVDDEELFVKSLTIILSKEGYDLSSFLNGEDAVNYYKSNWKSIDLIILDMIMPIMDGEETFVELKKINPDLKVIILSGYSLDYKSSKILDNGVLGYIQKPVSKEQLMKNISKALKPGRKKKAAAK